MLLLLLLIGFFQFGGDVECERGERGGERRGPGSFPGPLTPRVSTDGRPRGSAALDGELSADRGGHNRSDCVPPRPPLPKCEVGARGPWRRESQGRRAPSRATRAPVGITTPGELRQVAPALTSRPGTPTLLPGSVSPFVK